MMKNIFWLWEDDAQWARSLLLAIVIIGAIIWIATSLDLSIDLG